MAFTEDLRLLLVGRCLSGIGLGALTRGMHVYLQAVFGPERPPREAALLTSARHTGLFSGAALGALVAAHQGPRQSLLLGGLAGLLALIYALALLPPLKQLSERTPLPLPLPRSSPPTRRIRIARSWRAPGFLSATLLIGIPTLLIRKGVISFALPLLLAHQGRDLDGIGQLLVLYAVGVLLSHHLIATRRSLDIPSRRLLQAGMAGSGLGLLAIGFMDALPAFGTWADQGTLCAVAVGVLGLSHGLVHEPLERHLLLSQNEHPARNSSLFLHHLMGGLGQSIGPMLVSVLLLALPNQFQQLGWLGVLALLLSATFSLASRNLPGQEVHRA
jgi:predicted MFS family arabinose efflux permease